VKAAHPRPDRGEIEKRQRAKRAAAHRRRIAARARLVAQQAALQQQQPGAFAQPVVRQPAAARAN
jgi:hypothetical protein